MHYPLWYTVNKTMQICVLKMYKHNVAYILYMLSAYLELGVSIELGKLETQLFVLKILPLD